MLSHKQITDLSIPLLQLALEAGQEILEVYRSEDLQVERKADFSPLTLADRRAHDVIDAGLRKLAPEIPVLSEEGRDIPHRERESWEQYWLVDPLDGTKEFIKGNGEFTVNIGLLQENEPVLGIVYAPVCGVAYVGICPAGAPELDLPERKSPERQSADRQDHVFPEPGAYRFVIDHDLLGGEPTPAAEELDARAEPIGGARPSGDEIRVIASRSHMGRRTRQVVNQFRSAFDTVKLVHVGSSLKLCMIAEGSANIYPRIWPTMEWDTAAGHALVRSAGGEIWQSPRDGKPIPDWLADEPVDSVIGHRAPLPYNKKDLTNASFVARGW